MKRGGGRGCPKDKLRRISSVPQTFAGCLLRTVPEVEGHTHRRTKAAQSLPTGKVNCQMTKVHRGVFGVNLWSPPHKELFKGSGSQQGDVVPQRTFWVATNGEEVRPAPSRWRPGMLLTSLRRTDSPDHKESSEAQRPSREAPFTYQPGSTAPDPRPHQPRGADFRRGGPTALPEAQRT